MKLDIGCGKNKRAGFIGLDRVRMPGVDVVCDLDKGNIPLADNSVEEVYSMHFMEHVFDLLFVMGEVWRVCTHGAKVTIAVPYFTSVGAFRDPTHRQFFTFETFDHFTDTKTLPSFYSEARFRIVQRNLLFYPSNSNLYGQVRFAHMIPFQLIANMFPYFYEHSLLKLFSPRDLYVELRALKK